MVNGGNNLREFGEFRLDTVKRVLWFGNEPVNLPLKEIELLTVLTENPGQVITKDEILKRVWPDSFVEESNLSRHIYLLRKTFRDHGESEDLIQTVPRRGYRFTGDIRNQSAALVIERHTSTKTIIEIEDSEEARLPVRSLRLRTTVLGITAFALLTLALTLTWAFWPVPAKGAEIRSLAVLPVRSFSNNTEDEELRLRITDALITRLGGMSRIAVRPTSAVLPFVGSEIEGLAIGRKLKVDAIIDSRLQQEAERLRVTIQLIRVSNGEHLWSEQFDGSADQILKLQDSIFAKVARSLPGMGQEGPGFPKRATEVAEAYEAYLKGRYFWTRRDEASLRRAIDYFDQAAELDPQFAEAYVGLADTRHLLFNYNIDLRPEVVIQAKEELKRALELKPDAADALTTLGTIQMGYDWDWNGAEASLKHAISAAPNSAVARIRYGALLVRIRRFDESIAEFEKAIELDPLSITANTNLGMALFCKKDFAAADRQYAKVAELDDKVAATRWLLSRSYWLQGRHRDAVNEIVAALEMDRNPELADKVRQQASSPAQAIRVLLDAWRDRPAGTNPHNLAYLSTYVGDAEKSIQWLQRSLDEHHPWSTWFASAPEFEQLRNDQSYLEILKKLQLP